MSGHADRVAAQLAMGDGNKTVRCRGCKDDVPLVQSTLYRGFGRLCSDCDARATVVSREDGTTVRVSIGPKK